MFLHITIDFFANLALALTSVALTTRLRSLRVAKRIVGAQISGKGGNLGKMWAGGGFAEAITTSKEPHLSTQLAEWQFSKKINSFLITNVFV